MANIGIAQTAITVTPISTGGGSNAFSALTTSTNTTATMTVGSGASLTFSGTGVVNANEINGVTPVNYQGFYAEYLPGMSIVDPGTFNLGYAATTSIYTVPSNMRAIFLPTFTNWGFMTGSARIQVVISSTTYNLTPTMNIAANTGSGGGFAVTPAYVAEAGEVFQITTTQASIALTKAVPNTALSLALTSVGAGNGVYQGTITGGAANAYIGYVFTITGFTNPQNNGTFYCTASTATALTLNGTVYTIAETASGTATSSASNTGYLGTTSGVGQQLNGITPGQVVIAGFTNGGNNGTFNVLSWGASGFAVTNGSGVAETHAGTANANVLNLYPTILLFSNQAPTATVPNLKSVKLTSTSLGVGANTLYTVPGSTSAYLAGDIPFLSNNSGTAGGIGGVTALPTLLPGVIFAPTGSAPQTLWTVNFVRSGGSASVSNFVGTALTAAAANIQSIPFSGIMVAGDTILVTVNNATAAPALIWANVWEY